MDGSTVHFPARAPQNSQGTSPPGRGGIAGRVTGREGSGLQWMVGGSCAVPRLSWQKFDWMVASIRRASTFSRSALPTAAHSPLVSAVRLEVDVCGGDTGAAATSGGRPRWWGRRFRCFRERWRLCTGGSGGCGETSEGGIEPEPGSCPRGEGAASGTGGGWCDRIFCLRRRDFVRVALSLLWATDSAAVPSSDACGTAACATLSRRDAVCFMILASSASTPARNCFATSRVT